MQDGRVISGMALSSAMNHDIFWIALMDANGSIGDEGNVIQTPVYRKLIDTEAEVSWYGELYRSIVDPD